MHYSLKNFERDLMFKNYFILGVRNIIKYKMNSLINIFGLSTAIALSIIIYTYSGYVLNYNTFFTKSDRIYQVYKERSIPTGTQIVRDTWFPMAESMEGKFPGIEQATHIWATPDWVIVGNKKFKEEVTWVKDNVFEMFDYPLLYGNPEIVFSNPNSAVLSYETALKYFGNTNPVGKSFNHDYRTDYSVSGVLKPLPGNITYRPDIMVPSSSVSDFDEMMENWGSSWLYTYILLNEKEIPDVMEAKFPDYVSTVFGEDAAERMSLKLTPLLSLNDAEYNSNIYAYILLGVAFVIILVAVINYVNISTARSLDRVRETGLRKVLGATKWELTSRFFIESTVLSLISVLMAMGLTELLLPVFNNYFELNLSVNYFDGNLLFLSLIGLSLLIGFVSSLYPSMILLKFVPADSLRGSQKTNPTRLGFRNALVIFQFGVSIVLISATGIMNDQISFMKNADLNFNKNNVMVIRVEASDFADQDEGVKRIASFKSEISRLPSVAKVAYSTHVPGDWAGWHSFVYPSDRDKEQRLRQKIAVVDDTYFDTYGIQFIQGENFDRNKPAIAEESLILNEAAMKDIGWQSIDEGLLNIGSNSYKILGVVKDYNFEGLENSVEPIIHGYAPDDYTGHNFISISLNNGDIQKSVTDIGSLWREFDSSRDFNYYFVDKRFDELYRSQEELTTVTGVFSFMVIVIASLGLFSIASLMVAYKTREIGIRKVMGASVSGIMNLFLAKFLAFVAIAFVIAVPVTTVLMSTWLEDFAYRTSLSYFTMLLSGIIVLVVAVSTTGYHTLKAALSNPVNSMRHE